MAAVRMGREGGDMAAGLRRVTAAPAAAAGLTDRGALEVGRRADVIRVSAAGEAPMVRGTWVGGLRRG